MPNSQLKSDGLCKVFGCYLAKETEVDVTIDEVTSVIEVCTRHEDFFQSTPIEDYAIGLTFLGELEVRLIAAQPAVPVAPEE
jgi:hypothetical protein